MVLTYIEVESQAGDPSQSLWIQGMVLTQQRSIIMARTSSQSLWIQGMVLTPQQAKPLTDPSLNPFGFRAWC